MLRADGLGAGYPGRNLLQDLSVEFTAGSVWGILGRNGSGKSTLLNLLAALRDPDRGDVLLEGQPVRSLGRRALASKVGILFQEETVEFWGSARDYVQLGRHPHAEGAFSWSAADEQIADSELERQHLESLSGRPYASLSGGERQRTRAAALFAQRPRVFLVDEPLQHLDLPHQVLLLERLAAEARAGAVVVMVLHDLVFAGRYCDHFLLLHGDGGFEAGTREQVFDAQRLGALYGFPVESARLGDERLFLPRAGAGPHV